MNNLYEKLAILVSIGSLLVSYPVSSKSETTKLNVISSFATILGTAICVVTAIP